MANLTPGGNASLITSTPRVSVTWSARGSAASDLDVSAFVLRANGKVGGDADMVFFNQPSTRGVSAGPFAQASGDALETRIAFDLPALAADIEKIAITATLPAGVAFAGMPFVRIAVADGAEIIGFDVPTSGMKEQALIVGELYRRNGAWKFRAVGQGFFGGLEPLAKSFGVDVAAPAAPAPSATPPPAPPPAAPPPPAPPKISLSKISLTKEKPGINLSKPSGSFGEIKVNLNWNRGGSPPQRSGGFGGLFGGGARSARGGIDLDLGCLFKLKDGYMGVVQALGNAFGSYEGEPFIQLASDDRTGASTDGEWIRVNGRQWSQIDKILVFASIYEGVPNWASTDGVVTVFMPGQPEIEVRLVEGRSGKTCCAVAMIENVGDAMRISRLDTYFAAVDEMDRAYRWGLRWSAGSKD
ncbi:TerD family protein [Chenggangzhangella methanolivorans]|uniref:TerD domain-containing protein n=1 Tax=Chenggangzhangella methanolivorans TaxID=1437009 RepID=A0A9E6RCD4_9HYPH|nr:TerD domain-containing protein [Chenggangzhangella methanolivorans]QZO00643.1 TerD domain-containing protein [Chenggangzhangella methanolivorans]